MPTDTVTLFNEVSGTGNTVLVSGTTGKTILGVAMQQQNVASDTDVRCGTTVIARNYATNFSYVPINKVCYDTINIQKTGNDTASVIVNYVPYDLSLMSTTTQEVIVVDVKAGGYVGPTFNEWLFVSGIVVFLVSFMVWGRFNFFRA